MAGHPPPAASARAAPLSAEAVAGYERDGYVLGLPVLDDASVRTVQARFRELLAKLPAGTDINRVNCWHKANRWVYELSRFDPILDYVQCVLGDDFYCWGAQFFCKLPAAGEVASADNRRQTVPWHQDGQYWPLAPLEAATVWLAVFDTDASNGAMQVVAGSHRDGAFEHRINERADYALAQEIPAERIDDERVVSMDLRAGQMSLHDIGLVHGSTTGSDGRPRVGTHLPLQPRAREGRSGRVAVLRSLSRARHGAVPQPGRQDPVGRRGADRHVPALRRVPLRPRGHGPRYVPLKPISRWVPSQNGLLLDAPQRQRAILSDAPSTGLPRASSRGTGPLTRRGPLSLIVILMSAMSMFRAQHERSVAWAQGV